jgi:hypothetical protein
VKVGTRHCHIGDRCDCYRLRSAQDTDARKWWFWQTQDCGLSMRAMKTAIGAAVLAGLALVTAAPAFADEATAAAFLAS